MSLIDPSYVELVKLLSRPLTEEFEPPWSTVRSFFWGVMPMAVLSPLILMAFDAGEEYADIHNFFWNLSVVCGVIALLVYLACAWKAHEIHQMNERSKTRRSRQFRD